LIWIINGVVKGGWINIFKFLLITVRGLNMSMKFCKSGLTMVLAIIGVGMFLFSGFAFAAATDVQALLGGAKADLVTAIKDHGTVYIYGAEAIAAAIAYIKTRNITVFIGLLALSIFLTKFVFTLIS
jgi:hypothetical protein